MKDNDQPQKPAKKRAMELRGTTQYMINRGVPLPEAPSAQEVQRTYDENSKKHLEEAGADMYEAIVSGEEPYVQAVNDALENPDVRKKLNPNTAKIIIIENGCNPNLVDGAYLNEENVKSAVAKSEEREQWLGDREIMVMKREKELDAANADPTEPNATVTCGNCGGREPVGKTYQEKMTKLDEQKKSIEDQKAELAERERIVGMSRKETEALRKEIEAREEAAKDNEYFVGRETLNKAGWKDEAQLGTYLEIMKPDVEPVTTESYTLNDGSLFKKAELATDSKIIGVKSAKPIKIEKRDEFFVTWQQKIDHYAAHVEIWADMISDKADEKYAESYLKMVLGHVDAAVDSAKRNNFVRAYKHLEEARGIPIPPGPRLVMPPVPPPAPSEDAEEADEEKQDYDYSDEEKAEIDKRIKQAEEWMEKNKVHPKYNTVKSCVDTSKYFKENGDYFLAEEWISDASDYVLPEDGEDEAEPADEPEPSEEKSLLAGVLDEMTRKSPEDAEKPAIETKENYEMFSYYVAELVEDSKAEGITIHPSVFSAVMNARMKNYDSAFDHLEQAQKYHERYLAEKKDIAKKKDKSGSGDVIRYEGHDLDLLFGGPKLTAEQAVERMRNVLGSNYDERIKITGATDGMTLAKVVTHVDIPMGTPAAREIEKYLREQEAEKALGRVAMDDELKAQGGHYDGLREREITPAKSQSAARRFINFIKPELKRGETRGQYLKRKFGMGSAPLPAEEDGEVIPEVQSEPVDNHVDVDDDAPVDDSEE